MTGNLLAASTLLSQTFGVRSARIGWGAKWPGLARATTVPVAGATQASPKLAPKRCNEASTGS